MATKYLDTAGLTALWSKIKGLVGTKQDTLTAAQQSAVDSGITSTKVSTYDGYATTIAGKAASSHTHGNISNAGALTNAAPTIATGSSGDYLVITDTSDSNKVGRGLQFSGASGKFLTASGTWATPGGTYSLPTASDTQLGGIKVGTNLSISDGVLSAVDTTYSNASTSAAGLMSAADKSKLDGIAAQANKYSLPTASADTLGGVKVGTNLSISNGVLSATDTTYSEASQSAAGLMSADDKKKLDGVASGANAYTLPNATTSAKGGVIVGTNISVSSGTISVATASTSAKGVVQLSSAVNSTSESLAATAKAVKTAYDLANGKQSPATTLAGYGITNAYTKTEVDNKLSGALHYKGTSATFAALTATVTNKTYTPVTGDVWNITVAGGSGADGTAIKAGDNVAYNGTGWDVLGGTTDLSNYYLKTDIEAIPTTDVEALS